MCGRRRLKTLLRFGTTTDARFDSPGSSCHARDPRKSGDPGRPRRPRPVRPLRRPVRSRNPHVRPRRTRPGLRRRQGRPGFRRRVPPPPRRLRRPAVPAILRRAADTRGRRARIFLKREDLNHTGAHKINNAIGQGLLAKRMGKKRDHRRDGGRPARRRHAPPPPPCSACPAASTWGPRTCGGRGSNVFKMRAMGTEVVPRRDRQPDPAGRHQRGHARVDGGGRRRRTTSSAACVGPHPFPDDGPRLPGGHRRGDARAMPGADRPAAGRRGRLRRRRQQRGRHVLPVRRRRGGGTGRRRGGRPRSRPAATTPPRWASASPASCTARSATSCRTTTARRPRSIRSRPGWTTPASARSTATGRTPSRVRYTSVGDDEALRGFARARGWRGSCRRWRRRTPSSRRCASPPSGRRTTWSWSASPAAATRTASRSRRLQAKRHRL